MNRNDNDIIKEKIFRELRSSIEDAITIVCYNYTNKIHLSEINKALSSILLSNTSIEVKKIRERKKLEELVK